MVLKSNAFGAGSARHVVFARGSARPSVWYWTSLSSKVNRDEFSSSPGRISTVILKVSRERTCLGLRFLCDVWAFQSRLK